MRRLNTAGALAFAILLSGCGGDEAATGPVSGPSAPGPATTSAPAPSSPETATAPRNPFLAPSSWPIYHANTYATASAKTGPGPVTSAQIIGSLTSLLAPCTPHHGR